MALGKDIRTDKELLRVSSILTNEDYKNSIPIAKARINQKKLDRAKHKGATQSFGGQGESRSYEEQLEDNIIGVLAEFIIHKKTNTKWLNIMGQYKDGQNKRPDLEVSIGGKMWPTEVRGSRMIDTFIHRPWQKKDEDDKYLFFSVSNFNKFDLMNSMVRISYTFARDFPSLRQKHPECRIKNNRATNEPFYFPTKYLSKDLSIFDTWV